jgi:hypothetical protein
MRDELGKREKVTFPSSYGICAIVEISAFSQLR